VQFLCQTSREDDRMRSQNAGALPHAVRHLHPGGGRIKSLLGYAAGVAAMPIRPFIRTGAFEPEVVAAMSVTLATWRTSGAIRSRTGASLRSMRGGTSGPYGRSSIKHPWSAQRGPCSPMERSVIRDKLIPEPHRHPRIARPKPVASSGLRALLLQQCRDGLDAIAGIFRQPGANRISGIERAVSGEHLRGYEIAQDGDAFQLLFLLE
jgi:hypothetical protein